jgi:hypothetical protein
MEEILKKLLDSEVFTNETREKVKEAFAQQLTEAKAEQEKAVRSELTERYEKDKKAIHAALEQYLDLRLTEHVKEFRNGVEEVNKLKSQYADRTVKVAETAQDYVGKRLGAVEKVIEGVLQKELSEVHDSEKTNRRAYLNAITEARAEATAERNAFRKKAAAVLENIVNVQVQSKLDTLQEDIRAARQADFGRELFETFYTTFRRQFFNSSKEFKKLAEALRKAKTQLAETKKVATKKVEEAGNRAKAAEFNSKKLKESVQRSRTIGKMLSGLTGTSREKMKIILEATKTEDLRKAYKRVLPEIFTENKKATPRSRKQKLEDTVVELQTGGRETVTESKSEDHEFDEEIAEIVTLAGIKK